MARKRIHIRGYLILIIIAAVLVLSYMYSRRIYIFYLGYYWEKIRGWTPEDRVRIAEDIYRQGDYDRAADLLRTLHLVYPDDRDIAALYGRTLIMLGDGVRGADMILLAFGNGMIPEEILEDTARTLFDRRHYRDLIDIFSRQTPGQNPNLLYYYGIALFETGDYRGAIERLTGALREGRRDYEVYLFLGRAHDLNGDSAGALPHLERAREMNVEDPRVARTLAKAYRKLGRYNDAARILRSLKRLP
ncbi:MAG: tetratricopeptide repeat protein [Spirochaetes bacterium]|nr:tetratricopeptide repeat protein [Spirochaetota bacterium]